MTESVQLVSKISWMFPLSCLLPSETKISLVSIVDAPGS